MSDIDVIQDKKVDNDTATKKPDMYCVILLNDDYTSMEFVVYVLSEVFRYDSSMAERMTMDIHKNGQGVIRIYTKEIAEHKQNEVMKLAKAFEMPLQCIVEKA